MSAMTMQSFGETVKSYTHIKCFFLTLAVWIVTQSVCKHYRMDLTVVIIFIHLKARLV